MDLWKIILFYDVFMPSWINSRFNSFYLTIYLPINHPIWINEFNKTGYGFTYFDGNNSKKNKLNGYNIYINPIFLRCYYVEI